MHAMTIAIHPKIRRVSASTHSTSDARNAASMTVPVCAQFIAGSSSTRRATYESLGDSDSLQNPCRSPRSCAQRPAPALPPSPDSSGARLACGVRNGAVRETTTSEGATMRVGFIGQGAMGSRMAARLLAAGHDLVVFDRLREATRPLEQRGATVAASAKQLAGGVDVVFSSVTDDTALEQVMLRSDGALAGARPGTTVIDMSTVSPRMSRRLHDAARAKGVAVLDAPVSGSTPQAEQGQLVIFVGGEED